MLDNETVRSHGFVVAEGLRAFWCQSFPKFLLLVNP